MQTTFAEPLLGSYLSKAFEKRYLKGGSNEWIRIGERFCSPQNKERVAYVVCGSRQSWLPRGQAPWRAVAKAINAEEFVS